MNYGLKDVHWTPDDKGNPILNERGKADALVPFRYITQGPVALYYTRDPQYAQIMQDAEKAMFPFVSINPTDGYYSPTVRQQIPGPAARPVRQAERHRRRPPADEYLGPGRPTNGATAAATRCARSTNRKSPHQNSCAPPRRMRRTVFFSCFGGGASAPRRRLFTPLASAARILPAAMPRLRDCELLWRLPPQTSRSAALRACVCLAATRSTSHTPRVMPAAEVACGHRGPAPTPALAERLHPDRTGPAPRPL